VASTDRSVTYATARDITEQKRKDIALSELNQNLVRANAQLQAANKELESFSYSVSHDLRAPLRGIDGFSQALLEDYGEKFDETGRDYLQRVRAATQRMGRLIDDILNLSRVTRGEMRLEQVDVSAIAAAVMAELRLSEPQRRAEIKIAPGISAKADQRLLRVVLDNLLSNAWKFTSRRPTAHIEVGFRLDGTEATYFVRDNGAGFDMKYADRLFGAFQRLHADTDFGGTGIGLATVQRIINHHGGRVWVEAAVDKGATFCFSLPAAAHSLQQAA
jgi:light-regulated signal transduction histidine kinase (bacteriophytochrome)